MAHFLSSASPLPTILDTGSRNFSLCGRKVPRGIYKFTSNVEYEKSRLINYIMMNSSTKMSWHQNPPALSSPREHAPSHPYISNITHSRVINFL
jgi:hypothetical protein